MKKEYITPEISAVRFNTEDIIRTSNAITKTEMPKAFTGAAQVADQPINVFGE